MDAAHFVFAPFWGYLWCFARLFVKAPSGRKRFNVLGALNATSNEMITVTNSGYIDSLSVFQLLAKLYQRFADLPITVVLDNARYQKCRLVQNTARLFEIELLYLPSYSQNLNLIERVWKFVKRKCLYSTCYCDFEAFAQAVSQCLTKTKGDYKKEMVGSDSSVFAFMFRLHHTPIETDLTHRGLRFYFAIFRKRMLLVILGIHQSFPFLKW